MAERLYLTTLKLRTGEEINLTAPVPEVVEALEGARGGWFGRRPLFKIWDESPDRVEAAFDPMAVVYVKPYRTDSKEER